MEEENIFSAYQDTSEMTDDEYKQYGYSCMKTMLRMERNAARRVSEKDTPFQRMILETARHHVDRCEKTYGINRQNVRI